MAKAMEAVSDWGPCLSYWGSYCKDTFGQALVRMDLSVKFSEVLLRTLYFETDVGCIPRGNKLGTKPKYEDSHNWNVSIRGCYWCSDDRTDLLGICCSKDCIFYLHDWCIERVEFFTNRKFCRLPGCGLLRKDNLYCSPAHQGKFDAAFPQFVDHKKLLRTVIRSGPTWYALSPENSPKPNSTTNLVDAGNSSNSGIVPNSYTRILHNSSVKNQKPCIIFPEKFRQNLIYNTDVGVIPRGGVTHQHLASKYSDSPNWSAQIKGCYDCGNRDVGSFYNELFCRVRCELVFYEWCRMKIERETDTKFCQLPGCPIIASGGYECCNKEHSAEIKQKYEDCKINDKIDRLKGISPRWYNKSLTPFESIPHPKNKHSQGNDQTPLPMQQTPPIISSKISSQPQCPSPNFIFPRQLTEFLYFNTDVGPIPREIQPFMQSPPPPSLTNPNWLAPITQCYWCCSRPQTVHFIACSDKCFFFFNEWVHKKFTNFSQTRLCRALGCPSNASQGFQCCNRDHSIMFESSFKQYFPCLKDTEFHLGPVWYTDFSRSLINFYHREDPFYEFSNFYPCKRLRLSDIDWKTSEHYFQASKFSGTPYFKFISDCHNPRDALQFSRERAVQKWIHPLWHSIKLKVMYRVLVEKFIQDESLRTILLRTGNAKLVEHTKNDKIWGDGGDGSGENKLGILLVQVRDHIRSIYPNALPQHTPQHFQHNFSSPSLQYGPNNSQFNNTNPIPPHAPSPVHTPRPPTTGNSSDNERNQSKHTSAFYHPNNCSDTKSIKSNNSELDKNSPVKISSHDHTENNASQQQDSPKSTPDSKSDPPQGVNSLNLVRGVGKHPLPEDYVSPFNITSSPIIEDEQIVLSNPELSPHHPKATDPPTFSFSLAKDRAEQTVHSSFQNLNNSDSSSYKDTCTLVDVDMKDITFSKQQKFITTNSSCNNNKDQTSIAMSSSELISQSPNGVIETRKRLASFTSRGDQAMESSDRKSIGLTQPHGDDIHNSMET